LGEGSGQVHLSGCPLGADLCVKVGDKDISSSFKAGQTCPPFSIGLC
jgi:hypothetical protein